MTDLSESVLFYATFCGQPDRFERFRHFSGIIPRVPERKVEHLPALLFGKGGGFFRNVGVEEDYLSMR